MDWNSFNRELQNRVSDPGTRYCLGIVYERLLDVAKQQDMTSELINMLANTMNNFVALNEAQDAQLKAINKHIHGREQGVSVESVPITNDGDGYDR